MSCSAFLLWQAEEASHAWVRAPEGGAIEGSIVALVQWLRLGVETIGAFVIALGVLLAVWQFVRLLAARTQVKDYNQIRLTLARYLALALEFQLGADILSTAIAPSWDQIGKLGAIAVIRTALNYFLMREMKEEQVATESATNAALADPGER